MKDKLPWKEEVLRSISINFRSMLLSSTARTWNCASVAIPMIVAQIYQKQEPQQKKQRKEMKMKMKKATTRRCEKRAKGVWLLNGNPWGGQKEKGILKENLTVWKAKSDRFCQESPGSSRLIFWIGEEAKKVLYFPYFHNISFDPFDKVGVLSSQLEGNSW